MYTNEEDCNLPSERRKYPTPHKNEVISCLGIGGKWVTSQFDLQVRLNIQSNLVNSKSLGLEV